MDKTYELFRSGGLLTTIKIKDLDYGLVEFTTKQYLHENGKDIVNSSYTNFYTSKELKEFFEPIINDLQVKFKDANSI
jgi:hypothetical protein